MAETVTLSREFVESLADTFERIDYYGTASALRDKLPTSEPAGDFAVVVDASGDHFAKDQYGQWKLRTGSGSSYDWDEFDQPVAVLFTGV